MIAHNWEYPTTAYNRAYTLRAQALALRDIAPFGRTLDMLVPLGKKGNR